MNFIFGGLSVYPRIVRGYKPVLRQPQGLICAALCPASRHGSLPVRSRLCSFYLRNKIKEEHLAKMGTEAGSSDVLVPASMAASELDAFHSSPKKQPKDVSRALQRYSSEPRLLIVAGPSGVGKGTIVKQLRAYWPSAFGFSVSHTSRQPRPGEAHTREYHFVSREEIEQMRDNGELLEYAEFSGNAYATSFGEIKRISDMGKICLLEIDLCGVLSVREHAFSFAKFVFIEPPSFAELEKRLRLRNTETPESLQRRLEHAKNELERANHLEWDLRLVNDSVEAAWGKLRDALIQWFDLPPNPEK